MIVTLTSSGKLEFLKSACDVRQHAYQSSALPDQYTVTT
jgi:hypothetical protein